MTLRGSDVEKYLQHARRVPSAPAELRARVDARMKASLAATASTETPGSRPGAFRVLRSSTLVVGAACLALLCGLLVVGRNSVSPSRVPQCEKPGKRASASSDVANPVDAASFAEPVPAPTPSAPRALGRRPRRDVPRAAPSPSLGEERELLARARASLARGELSDADRTLAQHALRFDRGALAEEREALRVHAAAMGGDLDAAATLLRTFERRFPESVFTPTLRDALNRYRGATTQ